MSRPLLLILNPRQIPECISAIERLPIDKAWLTNYTEHELELIIPNVLDACDHDPIGVISDDTIPTPDALTSVLEILEPGTVTTGYCRLDETSNLANLSTEKLPSAEPSVEAYTFPTIDEVQASPTKLRTYFAGHSLTFLYREHWERYPWRVFGDPPGCASDYLLSHRLQEDDVPIYAHPRAYIEHVKRTFNTLDPTPGRQLLIGIEPANVRWETQ